MCQVIPKFLLMMTVKMPLRENGNEKEAGMVAEVMFRPNEVINVNWFWISRSGFKSIFKIEIIYKK